MPERPARSLDTGFAKTFRRACSDFVTALAVRFVTVLTEILVTTLTTISVTILATNFGDSWVVRL